VLVAIGPAVLKATSVATNVIPIVAFDLETDPVQGGYTSSSGGMSRENCSPTATPLSGFRLPLISDPAMSCASFRVERVRSGQAVALPRGWEPRRMMA
jgi:hypothetical protein